jgi:hypothetical protein
MHPSARWWFAACLAALAAAVPSAQALIPPRQHPKCGADVVALSKLVTGHATVVRDGIYTPAPHSDGTVWRERVTQYNVRGTVTSSDCDEEPCGAPLNATFLAEFRVQRRETPPEILGRTEVSRRGFWVGTWKIVTASGAQIAYGGFSGVVNGSSHNGLPGVDDQEVCDPRNRFEGSLSGKCRILGPGDVILGEYPIGGGSVFGVGMDVDFARQDPVLGCVTDFAMRIEAAKRFPCGLGGIPTG